MAAGSPSSATVPNFNPDEYRPPLHAFEPVGLKLYKPKATIYDDEVVLREPEIHFSVKNREPKEYIKVFGGSGKVKQWYEKLPQRAKELVDGTGFGVFVQLLGDTTSDHLQLIALAERWWDTTNTLHLPFGEATLTPLDFAAITGIRVGGHPIPFDMELYRNRNALAYFLGRVPDIIDAGTVRNSWFYETFKDYTCVTERDHEHVTRAFLLYLFGVALFPSKDGRVHLHYLAAMKDLSTVKDYDWGGAALATLYGHMGAISRGMTQSIGGYWRVLEIWSYEFLRMHVPRNSFSDPSVIPRGLKWVRQSKGKKVGGRDFTTYRLFLDELTKEQVNWDVWAGLDPVAHADLLRSRQANGRRILLEGPFCRQWYLGERVVRQSLGYDFFIVPKPIPVSMLRTRSLTIEDVGHWTEGEDAAIFLEEFGDYEEYRAQRLMSVLGVRIVRRGPPLGSQVRAVPTTIAAGGGAEVLVGGVLAELPKLSWQVDCYSSTGQIRYVDVPSPEHVDFTLPPSVQQVSREYAEAWFRHISGLRVLVRQQAMAGKTVRPPVMVEGSSFVVAARGTMTGTCEDKASTSAHTEEQPTTSTPPQTPPQIPISWPSDSIPSLNWIMTFQNALEWGSRNLAPHEFPTIFPATELCRMIEAAASILTQEPNCIQIDGLGADSVVVVGDVHGQLHDLIFLLRDAGFPGDNRVFVFNGDYVDRGAWGLETFLLLLAWKVAMPTKVFLLRGNHETVCCTKIYGFEQEVLTKYGGGGNAVYDKFLYCFGRLPLASVIAERVYTAHGGLFRSMATISSKKRKKTRKIIQEGSLVLGSLEELNKANRKYPNPPRTGANLIPNDVLWSDPSMNPGLSLNEGRGLGLLWGPDCTEDFLKKFNLTLIIRSHEGPDAREKRDDLGGMDNGYTIDHVGESGKLITLFSAPDYPQFQDTEEEGRYKNKGAYIVLEPPHFDSPVFHSFEAVTPRPQANPYYDYKNAIDSDEELDFASMES